MLVYGVRTIPIDGQQVSGATFWEEPEKSERKKVRAQKKTRNPDIRIRHNGWGCRFNIRQTQNTIHTRSSITGPDDNCSEWAIILFLLRLATDVVFLRGVATTDLL